MAFQQTHTLLQILYAVAHELEGRAVNGQHPFAHILQQTRGDENPADSAVVRTVRVCALSKYVRGDGAPPAGTKNEMEKTFCPMLESVTA